MKNPFRSIVALLALLATLGLSLSAAAQDAKAGEKKAAMCIGCHGIPDYKATFPEVYRVPKIAGQNAKYIISALGQYKKGDRKHPTMRGIAASLSDQDIADLAAFYATEAPSEPAPVALTGAVPGDVAELLKKGNCASCHGANFTTPIDPSYPKLAGQHGDYLYIALREYQTDKNALVGRNNAIMMGMARPFTPAEAKILAAYFASLPTELKTVPQSRFR
ncbi:MAG TPA: c-type cytochrome [Burkholderiaceae bacterium]|nr:c-type cytochrome [Burkholderiaceae bacterium]